MSDNAEATHPTGREHDTVDGWWQTTTNDEVATAPKLWRPAARHMGGFDLDPAAGCEPTPIAEDRYTPEDDGLTSPWYGTVWLNPPFSDKPSWYARLVDQYLNGDVDAAVALAKVDPSSDWFQNWFSTADIILLLDGRNWYLERGSSPSFSTMLGVWNPTDDMRSWAHTMGTVVETIGDDSEQQTLL